MKLYTYLEHVFDHFYLFILITISYLDFMDPIKGLSYLDFMDPIKGLSYLDFVDPIKGLLYLDVMDPIIIIFRFRGSD